MNNYALANLQYSRLFDLCMLSLSTQNVPHINKDMNHMFIHFLRCSLIIYLLYVYYMFNDMFIHFLMMTVV